ncbi:c-type cytochrome [Mucilaginibacter calamicampi]|uniref:C-type cytochrome n=1 Tax=Mucilaginibacter calamicampi TaxID=1302352 RepID=A0ABW2YVN8_9SPHI
MKWKVTGFLALFVVALIACQSDEELEFARYYSAGMVIYQSKCQNCHGSDGKGLAALIPALNNPAHLKANYSSLACLVKYGSKSSINPDGKTFGGEMPATDLPNVDIAKVLTYVTNSFGNKMGTINTQQVENNLKDCK